MLILNCGGTFNKRYNVVDGTLEVPYDNRAIDTQKYFCVVVHSSVKVKRKDLRSISV